MPPLVKTYVAKKGAIRKAAIKSNLTYREIAELTDSSQQSIGNVAASSYGVSPWRAKAIANALNTTIEELFELK